MFRERVKMDTPNSQNQNSQFQQNQQQMQQQGQQPVQQQMQQQGQQYPNYQFTNQYQPNMMPPQMPKKSRKLPIILSCVGVLAVAAIAVLIVILVKGGSKEEKVNLTMQEQIAASSSDAMLSSVFNKDTIGIKQLTEKMTNTPYRLDYSFTIDQFYELEELEGIGINNGYLISDPSRMNFDLGGELSYAGLQLMLDFRLCKLDSLLTLSSNSLLPKTYISADLDTLLDSIPMDDLSDMVSEASKYSDLGEVLSGYLNDYINSATLTELDTKNIQCGNTSVECKGYNAVISGEATGDFVNKIYSELERVATALSTDIENTLERPDVDGDIPDLNFIVYMDKNNNLVSLNFKLENNDGEVLNVDFNFNGEVERSDNIDGSIGIISEYNGKKHEENLLNFKKVSERNGNQLITDTLVGVADYEYSFTVHSETDSKSGAFVYEFGFNYIDLEVEVRGTISDVKKGKSFKLDLDRFKIVIDGDTMLSLSGEFGLSPYTSSIKKPSGKEYKFEELMNDESLFNELITVFSGSDFYKKLLPLITSGQLPDDMMDFLN